MIRLLQVLVFPVLVLLIASCQQTQSPDSKQNPLIAQVHHYELRQSDLDLVLSDNMSSADSHSISNAFIEHWIRNQLWNYEAEKHIKNDEKISRLVNSYRASLLTIEYESQVLKEKLDSTISEEVYAQTYEEYKTQFVLDEQIVQGWFARIPKTANQQAAFYQTWKQSDIEAVRSFCRSHSGECRFIEQEWIERSTLEKFIPSQFIRNDQIKRLSNFKKSDKEYNYYLKYSAFVDKNELAPLEYIKDELKRVILHGRKEKIIADLTEEMYEDKIRSNHIKVFTSPDK